MTRTLQEAVQTLCVKGHLDRAFDALSHLHTHPSTPTYLSLFTACSKIKALTHTRLLHSHLLLLGTPLSPLLGQHLVVALAKCGAVDDALHVSCALSHRTVFSWTAIISGFSSSGHGLEALKMHQYMLEDGVEPDHYTFVSLFKACGDIPDLTQGRTLHADARQRGFAEDNFVASTLIGMYSKCGAIFEAENVFNALTEHDAVTWNSMLSACVEHGERQKALHFWSMMQESGVIPNERTYVSALQLCITIAENEEIVLLRKQSSKWTPLQFGQALHADAHMRGFTWNAFVGNCLLSMYSKCGAIVEADYVFATLEERNGVSWNAMLSAYVMQGQGLNALRFFSDMVSQGVRLDQLTFVSAFQACAALAEKEQGVFVEGRSTKVTALRVGQALHADARRRGYALCPMVCNTLLSLYGKCGAVAEAEYVFGTMLNRNVVSWNAMLLAYIEQRQGKTCLHLYTNMELEGVSPDEGTFVLTLQACAMLAEKEETPPEDGKSSRSVPLNIGYALHADAHKKGFTVDIFINCTLVSMYGKCGAIAEAEHVFCAVPKPSVVVWNAMISAYVVQSHEVRALQLYRQMQEEGVGSDQLTYATVIVACATLVEKEYASHSEQQRIKMMSLGIGRALHADARCRCFTFDAFVGSSLMSMYAKHGAITEVEHAFDAISHQDSVSWNAMLSAYVERGMGQEALQLYAQMIKENMSSDQQTLVITLQACASLSGKEFAPFIWDKSTKEIPLDIARVLHAHALSKGLACNPIVGSALVSMYGKLGANAEGEDVFGKLSQRTVVTWTAMLSAYVEQGEGHKALQLYRQMQDNCIASNHITVTCILQACIDIGNFEICRELHFNIVSVGYDQVPSVSATLINAYGSYASMIDGQALFDKLLEADMVSWNSCIGGHAGYGNCVASLHMFEHLKCAGLKPDELTLTSVLAACSHSGFVVEGLEYLESTSRDYDIYPDLKHYATMLDLLGRAGDFKRAKNVLEKMPMQADQDILLSLLGACRAHGNLELAEQAFDIAANLQPKQATAYILMSNVYADAALREDAGTAVNHVEVGG
eukprot:c25273_g2_i5 orf=128-3292(+)